MFSGAHAAEEDIDRMIETGESETIFQKAILDQGRGRVLDTLAEIQVCMKDIQKTNFGCQKQTLDV